MNVDNFLLIKKSLTSCEKKVSLFSEIKCHKVEKNNNQ